MTQETRSWYERKYKTLVICQCAICLEPFVRPPREAKTAKYCSRKCRSAGNGLLVGEKNKHWGGPIRKKCEVCGALVKNKKKATKFCSKECFWVSGASPFRRADGNSNAARGAVDANQEEIVLALKGAGVGVISMAQVQRGVPDIFAALNNRSVFLEVKNPQTAYGRSGLTRMQKRFADSWQGEIYIVTSPEEALSVFGIGECSRPKDISGWATDRLGRV